MAYNHSKLKRCYSPIHISAALKKGKSREKTCMPPTARQRLAGI
jgi:hypothetical protein